MIPLNQLHIPSPCSEDWEQMAGDQQRRFCAGCGCHVHDLSALTRDQAQSVLDVSEGRVCVRYTTRPDGALQTLDDLPAQPSSAGRQPWLSARRLAAAISGVAALTLATLGAGARAAVTPHPGAQPGKPHSVAHPHPRRLIGKIAPHRPSAPPSHVLMGAPVSPRTHAPAQPKP